MSKSCPLKDLLCYFTDKIKGGLAEKEVTTPISETHIQPSTWLDGIWTNIPETNPETSEKCPSHVLGEELLALLAAEVLQTKPNPHDAREYFNASFKEDKLPIL